MKNGIAGLLLVTALTACSGTSSPPLLHTAQITTLTVDGIAFVDTLAHATPLEVAVDVQPSPANVDERVYLWLYVGNDLLGYDAFVVDPHTHFLFGLSALPPGLTYRLNFQVLQIEDSKAVAVSADTTVWLRGL